MKRLWIFLGIATVIAGIIISSMLLTIHYSIEKSGLEHESFCAISDTNNCDIVAASSYAVFLGLPVAGFSILYYLAALILLGVALLSATMRSSLLSFLFWYAIPSLLASLYMFYISAHVLGVYCILCISLYGISLLLPVFLWLAADPSLSMTFEKKYVTYAVTVLIIFGIGTVFLTSAAKRNQPVVSVDMATKAFLRGSLHDLEVDPATDPVWGNPDAKVTIVEFSDFQCPFCKLAAFKIRPYLTEFRNDVRFVYLHFPLDQNCNPDGGPMHPRACLAAYASECARKEGKFWPMHDDLFRYQEQLSDQLIMELAERYGMDQNRLRSCMEDSTTIAKVKSDIERANKININSTPNIFINGRAFRFWKNPEILRSVIKEEISK